MKTVKKTYRVAVVLWVVATDENDVRWTISDTIEHADSSDIYPNFAIDSIAEYECPEPPSVIDAVFHATPGSK